jgi:hypothetical protein
MNMHYSTYKQYYLNIRHSALLVYNQFA